MGREALCRAWFNGEETEGKALLETEEIIFRGPRRYAIRLSDIRSVAETDGRLTLETPGTTAILELGKQAAAWARAIQNPPTLADKLDIRTGSRVIVLGVVDANFWRELRARTGEIAGDTGAGEADLVFFLAEHPGDLHELAGLEMAIKRKGAIWVVSPRGLKEMADVVIMQAAKATGLVDVKVARFSETHTALKLVIPVARR